MMDFLLIKRNQSFNVNGVKTACVRTGMYLRLANKTDYILCSYACRKIQCWKQPDMRFLKSLISFFGNLQIAVFRVL